QDHRCCADYHAQRSKRETYLTGAEGIERDAYDLAEQHRAPRCLRQRMDGHGPIVEAACKLGSTALALAQLEATLGQQKVRVQCLLADLRCNADRALTLPIERGQALRSNRVSLAFVLLLLPGIALVQSLAQRNDQNKGGGASMLELTSTAFQNEGKIERNLAWGGEDFAPGLSWQGVPQGTKSFALIVHDPDAPRAGGWTHWVVYNLPASTTQLKENVPKQENLAGGGLQGVNDSGRVGYMGPCPPSGTHRYYFYLYALDQEFSLKSRASKADLESAMRGHILAQTELMGKFARSGG